MSVHQHKDGRWFCTFYEEGKKKFKYFGRGDIAEHQARRFDEETKRSRGKLWVDGGITIEELCRKYHVQHPVRESTADSDFYRLDRIILPILGRIQAETLSTQQLNEYVQKRLTEGKKRRTVAREISILKAAFNWGEVQDPPLIQRNPLSKYTVPKARDSEIPSPPTEEEVERILRNAPEHLIRAIGIQWYCGVRPGGEITRINWADVDFSANEVRIVSAQKGGPQLRYVPIHEDLRDLLLSWKEADRRNVGEEKDVQSIPVVHYQFRPVKSLKRSWTTAKEKAGVTRRLRLYDFRHAWFTNALRSGADLKATSQVGGHSRPDTTLRVYQHVVKDQHREVIQKIPGIKLTTKLTTIKKIESK